VIWSRKPSRPPVRALALATLTLVAAGFSASAAPAATPVGANTPTTTYAPSGGATAPGGGAAAASPPTATTTPAATTPAQATAPGKAASRGGDRPLSTGAIVIAALAALLVLGCVGWAFARSRAFEPHWLITLRHSAAEAGFRVSATWSELLDWARLGR
jgi:hypothetical protein